VSIAACTVVTRNHLAFARLAGRSWTDHHHGSPFTIVVVDHDGMAAPTWSHRDIRIVGPDAVGLAPDELRTWAAIYDAGELACALKPWALRHLLGEVDAAVYIDGDVEVLDTMADLEPLARTSGVVLSPHNLQPLEADGRLPDRFTMLKAGMYNGGLVAVGRSGAPFLDWWGAQLRRDGIHELHEGMHGDQRWLDFVPTAFDHHILRDPTFNVAYWNLHERPSSWDGDGLCVGGRRVRCFHYSGLTEAAPWSLSQFMADVPRVELRDHPAVARLCRRYIARLRSAGIEADRLIPYPYGTVGDGTPVDRRARRLWREQLLAAEADPTGSVATAPRPFADDGADAEEHRDAWLSWLRSPEDGDCVGRYLRQVWMESATLQQLFSPLEDPGTRTHFLYWVMTEGADVADIPQALLPEPEDIMDDDELDIDDVPRRRPPLPDVRAQQPLSELEAAGRAIDHPASSPGGGRVLRRLRDLVVGRRDRDEEVARHLVRAVAELSDRIAELGERINRVNDELPEQATRIDRAEDAAEHLSTDLDALTTGTEGRLARIDGYLASESRRIDGALEQDAVTAAIVADAESRLSTQLGDLEHRFEKLAGGTAE